MIRAGAMADKTTMTDTGAPPPAAATEPPLSEHCRKHIAEWVSRFPAGRQQSAVLAALLEVQHEHGGYLTTAQMDAVAEFLQMDPIAVYEVASFYSMLETAPVGRHSISVCTNVSCMLRGAERIVAHLEQRLGVRLGESTPDRRFYLKREEECLAACCGAPMMMVDHEYHEELTPEKVDAILEKMD